MTKILEIIFPIKLQLNILQLEEYKISRFLKWIFRNFFVRQVSTKKPLVYTPKIKNIIFIYFLICTISFFINPLLTILILVQPYLGLALAVIIIKPYELYNKYKVIQNTRKKILSFKDLKVIGITGSFGKSSTKEILYQLLKTKFNVLKTPESFNTVFGVAKVVDLELDKKYEYFICEMAAYKIGEIANLCYMVPPTYGILTGITTQHFERFGSLQNTIKAKFELVDAIKNKDNLILNLDDQNIFAEVKNRNIKNPESFLEAKNIIFDENGSSFEIVIKNKGYKVKTILFGTANIKNIIGAATMANKLGLTPTEIIKAIQKLKPVDNRLVLTETGKSVLVNNTYSSNPQGFKETIQTAAKIKGGKVLITPGLVELGKLETSIHIELGKLSQEVFDKIILVGKNNRTLSFASSFKTTDKIEFINDNRKEYFSKIEELKNKYDWIFLENDVTENY